jgi:hypothetical protein
MISKLTGYTWAGNTGWALPLGPLHAREGVSTQTTHVLEDSDRWRWRCEGAMRINCCSCCLASVRRRRISGGAGSAWEPCWASLPWLTWLFGGDTLGSSVSPHPPCPPLSNHSPHQTLFLNYCGSTYHWIRSISGLSDYSG